MKIDVPTCINGKVPEAFNSKPEYVLILNEIVETLQIGKGMYLTTMLAGLQSKTGSGKL